eukprot:GFUD01001470.1.p1 GENE.GFUD01001470.1~~GFUD01001470.1.p1  ORF type:complete len:459 (+),score=197.53 GFUD01001470.1:52-1428(+)
MASVSLAEPRRRQKWSMNPRGTMWSNDDQKVGQKMMEKMGWEKGRGLGANGDGMVDHITLKHKDNNKGVGFKGHDDTWLAHQDDFANVLAALNVEHGESGKKMNESEKKETLSEISKKSKRRVHYQKFVKGKDTSNYSADDLGCILGTKSEKLKSKSEPSSPQVEEEESEEDGNKNFVQRGNCTDYFAKKMAELKAKGKFTDVPIWTDAKANPRNLGLGAEKVDPKIQVKAVERLEVQCKTEELPENIEKKKKKSKNKKEPEEEEEVVAIDEPEVVKKKKSKKDRKEKLEFEAEETDLILQEPVEENTEEVKKKKSKKNKKKKEEAIETLVEPPQPEEEMLKKKKAKKSKKEKEIDEEEPVGEDSGCENEDSKTKKAKKRNKEKVKEKKLTYSDEEKENIKKNKRKADEEESPDNSVPKKKKSKKNKSSSTPTENPSKIPGFQGSNLLEIPGYGMEAN